MINWSNSLTVHDGLKKKKASSTNEALSLKRDSLWFDSFLEFLYPECEITPPYFRLLAASMSF